MKKPIPEERALEICELVRQRNKKFSFSKGQCWGCMKFSIKKNNVKARCIFGAPDNRGCQLVNKVFDKEYQDMN